MMDTAIIHNMEDERKIFMAFLKKYAKINKITQADLGKVIDRDQTTISNYYNDRSAPSIEYIQKWVERYGIDYQEALEIGRKELLASHTHPQSSTSQISNGVVHFNSKVDRDHYEIIQLFINKEKAVELNQALVEIERMSMGDFFELYGKILKLAHELKEKGEGGGLQLKKASSNDV